jgi:hypothetical protein
MRRHVLLPPLLTLSATLGVALGFAACRQKATAITPASAAPTEPFRGVPAAQSAKLPERLADSTWWGMVRDMSEPGGYFRSENFVSNEMGLQQVIARLRVTSPPGGVYVGVGPEQNFTYIAALQPRVAFIVDIRRQNLLQHLWYKAVFELSPTRSAFLARLFARPLPSAAAADETASADSLIARLEQRAADSAYFRRTFAEVRDHLVRTHGFTLDSADLTTLRYVDSVFYRTGPSLNYSSGSTGGFSGGRGFRGMPTFAMIATATDTAGANLGFLGTDASYQIVRDLQRRNLIVPLVGNFAGPRALANVGRWLRERDARVNTFYTSNVEQYLFQQGDEWSRFYANVAGMPLDPEASFIRSVTNNRFGGQPSGFLMGQLTSPIVSLVRDAATGAIFGYGDVIGRSK